MTDTDRWQELKDYLTAEHRAHDEIAASCDGPDLAATKLEQGGIVQGLKRALDKMQDLSARHG